MIVRSVVQMLLVSALKYGHTMAGENRVFDSLAGNILADPKHHLAPIIIVHGEDTLYSDKGPFGWKANQTFFVELAVLYADKSSAESPEHIKWTLPYSDPGAQYYVARLERQLLKALSPESSDFARLFNDGFSEWEKGIKSMLGGSRQKGVRFAARQLTLQGSLKIEPAPGSDMPGWLDDALLLLEADPAQGRIARSLRAELNAEPDAAIDADLFAHLSASHLSLQEADILGLSDFSGGELVWFPINDIKDDERVID